MSKKNKAKPAPVESVGMPGMPTNLWGASPLYENETLRKGSIPNVTPKEQVRDEGNCGWVTDRGKEACEGVRKRWVCSCRRKLRKANIATQTPSHQSCEATNRNLIQGRSATVSQPTMTKPPRSGGLVNQELVQRKLVDLSREDCIPWSASRACPKPGCGVGNLAVVCSLQQRS